MRKFVPAEQLRSAYGIAEMESRLIQKVHNHFMSYEDEVIYLLDNDVLYGCVSLGDLRRFYIQESTDLINTKFKYISNINSEEIEDIFESMPNIHELPVIESGKFLGVIYSGKKKEEREWNDARLEFEYLGNKSRYMNYIEKLLKEIDAYIYIYINPTLRNIEEILRESDYEEYARKRERTIGSAADLRKMTEDEKKMFFGDDYDESYAERFMKSYRSLQMGIKKGVCTFSDTENEFFTYKNGYRLISNAPIQATRKIFCFGPCTAMGSFVRDDQTLEFFLQQELIEQGYTNYEVVNCGILGEWRILARLYTEKISKDDIVIWLWGYKEHIEEELSDIIEKINRYRKTAQKQAVMNSGNWGEVYFNLKNPIGQTFDGTLEHCNHVVYQKLASKIYGDISDKLSYENNAISARISVQNSFISPQVESYYKDCFYDDIKQKDLKKKTGAIVMNCNPFTKGHRYLIEQACSKVDILFVFVVEEDKSYFKFEDRIEMVRRGTADLEKVVVRPSGKYVISQSTFSQYFEKDNVQEIEDMDYDVQIFGEVVAKELGIKYRFVGEEPFDKVTKKYNETMHKILPLYGIEVIEIPRVLSERGKIISASEVRRMIKSDNKEMLSDMLPDSTIEYLKFI